MVHDERSTISAKEQYNLEAKPDIALVKLYVTGEGMFIADAVENVHKKVSEICEALQSAHPQIQEIETFDVHFGQKEERFRNESTAYPRPLVVQGLLITSRPDEPTVLHRILDEGIKRGAMLDSPQRPSFTNQLVNSALLYGLIDSESHEKQAVEQCLKRADARCRALAAAIGKKIGKLTGVANVSVESSVGDPFQRDYVHVKRSFPTRFLSPAPDKVVICASLTASYELLDTA
jgi:uncharacterized protein YggE